MYNHRNVLNRWVYILHSVDTMCVLWSSVFMMSFTAVEHKIVETIQAQKNRTLKILFIRFSGLW